MREVKVGVDEVEKNCLFEEIRDKAAIAEKERMKRERRARGALRTDTGIMEKLISALGISKEGGQKKLSGRWFVVDQPSIT